MDDSKTSKKEEMDELEAEVLNSENVPDAYMDDLVSMIQEETEVSKSSQNSEAGEFLMMFYKLCWMISLGPENSTNVLVKFLVAKALLRSG